METIIFKSPVIIGCYVEDVLSSKLAHLPTGAGVYLITESRLGMKYVGSSINVRSRAQQHLHPNSETFRKSVFLDANPRYMTIELLEDCAGMEIKPLREREKYWINKLDTTYPKGLNTGSPAKGANYCMKKVYTANKSEEKMKPCYQLMRFSERMDFYIETLNNTPVNKNWFSAPRLLDGVKNQRAKYSHLSHAQFLKPQTSYSDNQTYWHPVPMDRQAAKEIIYIPPNKKRSARDIERFCVVKMDSGVVGVFERRGYKVITDNGKTAHKVTADTELEVLQNPYQMALSYLNEYKIKK